MNRGHPDSVPKDYGTGFSAERNSVKRNMPLTRSYIAELGYVMNGQGCPFYYYYFIKTILLTQYLTEAIF